MKGWKGLALVLCMVPAIALADGLEDALPAAAAGMSDGSAAPPVVARPLANPSAPDQPPHEVAPPGARTHDGFCLRMSVGAGYAYSNDLYSVTDGPVHGVAGMVSLAIGFMLVENLAVNADVFVLVLPEPTHDTGSRDFETATAEAVGIGLTYYFMPANVYLAGSVGFGFYQHKLGRFSEFESGPGFSISMMVGKEWWVSDNWGLGIAAQGVFIYAKENYPDSHIFRGTFGSSLLFSATYN